MEFVQFHPTALKHSSILISESARGEGGYLVNSDGKRFVDELLPRDVVARAIASEIRDGKDVFLDVRHLGEEKLLKLMPQEVHLARLHEGVDPVKELIPIKPVAHYTMGGIDVNSSFEVNGLKNCYAVGECSNSKVHGANRLGGNSLLEIISLGKLLGEIVSEDLPQDEEIISSNQLQKDREFIDSLFEEYPFEQNFYQLENNLGEKFYKYAGIVRDNNQLNNLLNKIRVIKADIDNMGIKDKNQKDNSNLVDFLQFLNILDVGEIVVESAIIRDESRGAHYKEAYSNEEPSYLAHSIFWIEDGAIQNRFQKVAKQ
jgi:succinate dehydrogenase / fumarate reductase flavoprotein subunit